MLSFVLAALGGSFGGIGWVKMQSTIGRRQLIVSLGAAAVAWPETASAQQAVPVIGFLTPNKIPTTNEAGLRTLKGIRQGLAEAGYVEGKNYRFEYRAAGLQYERYPAFVQEMEREQVALIIATSTTAVAAAKSTTQSVPIVFTIGSDPIENGFVDSLNRPGGNVTGTYTFNLALAGKRLELLQELLPSVTKFGFITNPASPKFNELETKEIEAAARSLGISLVVLSARKPEEFEAAFKTGIAEGVGGIIIGSEALFIVYPRELVEMADRYHVPAIFADDKPAKDGGLISYGADQDEGFHLLGIYAARILKGEKPADLPVQQSTKTKLVINLKTAKAFGITVPLPLIGRADEVIE